MIKMVESMMVHRPPPQNSELAFLEVSVILQKRIPGCASVLNNFPSKISLGTSVAFVGGTMLLINMISGSSLTEFTFVSKQLLRPYPNCSQQVTSSPLSKQVQ